MRPPSPVPGTKLKSTPFSSANFFAKGEAKIRPFALDTTGVGAGAAGLGAGAAAGTSAATGAGAGAASTAGALVSTGAAAETTCWYRSTVCKP
jgi:hypothetical protein